MAAVGVATAWLTCCFVLLQLIEGRRRIGVAAFAVALLAGLALLVIRDTGVGIGWLRGTRLRSDAIALGALAPSLAVAAAVLVDPSTRRSRWGTASGFAASIACLISGTAALVVGRSSWYWEFVALVFAGLLLALVSASVTIRGSSSPNMRVVFGSAAIIGMFLAFGSIVLLVAWRATGTN